MERSILNENKAVEPIHEMPAMEQMLHQLGESLVVYDEQISSLMIITDKLCGANPDELREVPKCAEPHSYIEKIEQLNTLFAMKNEQMADVLSSLNQVI